MHKVVAFSHVLAADYVDCNFCVRTPSRKARSLHKNCTFIPFKSTTTLTKVLTQ